MRVHIIILILIASFVLPIYRAEAGTVQRFESGRVDYINSQRIVVSGVTYTLANNVAVVIHRKEKDSLYESRGRLSEVKPGTPVFVMVIGTRVYEIMVERWKK